MKNKLRELFIRVYDSGLSRMEIKTRYKKLATSANITGCTGCQVNTTFNKYMSDAENLTPSELLAIKTKIMVTEKKKAAPKKAAPKKKAAPIATIEAVKKPTNIKFLYIPGRKLPVKE